MSPRPSYGSTATVISTDMGKKKSKFDVNEGDRILLVMLGKRGRDCVGWGIGETKANDVVQGLA